jgi:Bacterial Ig-like domain (group 3)/Squalene-hopene cyclase C-terminal domain
MFTARPLASAMAVGALAAAVAAGPTMASAPAFATTVPAAVPQVSVAEQAASWLGSQVSRDGSIPSATTPGTPDLEATANTVLALAAAGNLSQAGAGLDYLKGRVDQYVTVAGSDGPGELALLILGAHALGVDPRSFGGTDLVSRLIATEQTSGPDAGLFGAQDPTYDGAYREGISLASLAAAGVTSGPAIAAAETWLESQQCADGGWTSYVTSSNPCNGDPASFVGPDTNSTAVAMEGLAAEGALSKTAATHALEFLTGAQDADGGWGFEPNAADAPGSTDPDSTALVVQALLAASTSPSDPMFQRGNDNPVSALLSFVVSSGPGQGAFFYPGSGDPDTLATYQAIPAAAGVVFPFVGTSVSAASSPASTTLGTAVTYTATVRAGDASPAGAVTFATGSEPICTAAPVADGTASCTSSAAPAGIDAVTATFSGGPGFGLSSATTTVTVAVAGSTSAPGATTPGSGAIADATTVHTGEPFAGGTPFSAAVGAVGVSLGLIGAFLRRRSRSFRSS